MKPVFSPVETCWRSPLRKMINWRCVQNKETHQCQPVVSRINAEIDHPKFCFPNVGYQDSNQLDWVTLSDVDPWKRCQNGQTTLRDCNWWNTSQDERNPGQVMPFMGNRKDGVGKSGQPILPNRRHKQSGLFAWTMDLPFENGISPLTANHLQKFMAETKTWPYPRRGKQCRRVYYPQLLGITLYKYFAWSCEYKLQQNAIRSQRKQLNHASKLIKILSFCILKRMTSQPRIALY